MEYTPTLRGHLLGVFEDDQQCQTLQLQLAVTLDAGNPFVTGTYSLEGGGEAIGIAYRPLQEISIAEAVQNYPKTIAVAQEIAGGNQTEADGLVRIAKTCVAPAVRYFRERLNKNGTEMYDVVSLFKAVRIFCPMQAHDLHLTARDVEDLRIVPILHALSNQQGNLLGHHIQTMLMLQYDRS